VGAGCGLRRLKKNKISATKRRRTAAPPIATPAIAPELKVVGVVDVEESAAAEVCVLMAEVAVADVAVDVDVEGEVDMAVESWVDPPPPATPLAVRLT